MINSTRHTDDLNRQQLWTDALMLVQCVRALMKLAAIESIKMLPQEEEKEANGWRSRMSETVSARSGGVKDSKILEFPSLRSLNPSRDWRKDKWKRREVSLKKKKNRKSELIVIQGVLYKCYTSRARVFWIIWTEKHGRICRWGKMNMYR